MFLDRLGVADDESLIETASLRVAAGQLANGGCEQFDNEAPLYERLGQVRVNEGRYGEVVRYRHHVLPVLTAIQEAAGK